MLLLLGVLGEVTVDQAPTLRALLTTAVKWPAKLRAPRSGFSEGRLSSTSASDAPQSTSESIFATRRIETAVLVCVVVGVVVATGFALNSVVSRRYSVAPTNVSKHSGS